MLACLCLGRGADLHMAQLLPVMGVLALAFRPNFLVLALRFLSLTLTHLVLLLVPGID